MFNQKLVPVFLVLALFMAIVVGGILPSPAAVAQTDQAQNVILLIGDGMGPSHIKLAREYSQNILKKDLNIIDVMNKSYVADMTNDAADYIVPDSASAGTAMATGVKTNNGEISMLPDKKTAVETILEKSQKAGKKVGLVTTTRITHATPAVFAAHNFNRDAEDEIADNMLKTGADVMLGGGWSFWLPKSNADSKRKDDRDLTAEAAKAGYTVITTTQQLSTLELTKTAKLLGLFNKSHMKYEMDRKDKEPSLAQMTDTAIKMLSKGNKGFFLMVEGGRIDHAAHASDAAAVVHDMLAFDEAVATALDFQTKNPNTLIIVTADHETGGIAMTSGILPGEKAPELMKAADLTTLSKFDASFEAIEKELGDKTDAKTLQELVKKHTGLDITEAEAKTALEAKASKLEYYNLGNALGTALANQIHISFASTEHTAEPVWLIANGPKAEEVHGLVDNTEVFKLMSDAFQLK